MKLKLLLLVLFIMSFFVNSMQAQRPAEELLNDACEVAKTDQKNVMVIFTATWCGWCKRMLANIKSEACEAMFERNYEIVTLDVMERGDKKILENPGAYDLLVKYKAENSGIPFFLIFDANSNFLEDSFNDKGENLGCPASFEEVADFKKILLRTSSMTEKELAVMESVFVLKEEKQ